MEDLEARVAAYADTVVGSGTDPDAVPKSLYTGTGAILTASSTAATPVATAAGSALQMLQANPFQTSGVQWAFGQGPTYNVMDYGATGSSSTTSVSETNAINNCLAAAGTTGGTAYFPQGVYVINDPAVPVQVPSNIRMVGAGIGQSIVRAGPLFGNNALVRRSLAASSVSNVLIDGIEFDGNKANRGAFAVEGASGLVSLSGLNETTRSSNIQIVNSAVNNSHGLGWAIRWADHSTVIGCTMADNQRDGIMHAACHKVAVVGNHVYGCGDDHISMHSEPAATLTTGIRCYDLAVSGNVVGLHGTMHAGKAITVSGVQNCAIVGNSVRGGYHEGIAVHNNNFAPVEGLAIVGNTLHDSGTSADVAISGSSTGDYAPSGTAGAGILLDIATPGVGYYGGLGTSSITDVTIVGNTIRAPWRHGIRVQGENPAASGSPIRWVTIGGNVIVGAGSTTTGKGIWLERYTSDVVIADNIIRDFRSTGIECGTTGLDRIQISGGRVENCCRVSGGAAIKLGATADVTVGAGLRVLDNQGTPTQTAAIDWGTSTHPYVDGANFYLCSTGSTFAGSQPATAKLGSYVDRSGTLIGSGGSGGGTDVASVEDLFVSHTAMSVFPSTTNGQTVTYPVFVAPIDCDATALSIQVSNPDGGIAASDTNYYSVSLRRYRADAEVAIATKTTRATSPGAAIADRRTDWNFDAVTWDAANGTILKGDAVGVRWETFGTPTAITTGLVMTVKFEPA